MKRSLAVFVVGLLAAGAMAEQWYARGDFNGWGTSNPMTWDGTRNVATLTLDANMPAGNYYEFKAANADWSLNYPPDNIKTKYPALSSMNFYFYEGTISDGWLPSTNRVGYDLAGSGWEVIGDINGEGWGTGHAMTDFGNGHYLFDTQIATAGTHDFKFRTTGDWACSVGQHFGQWAPNASYTTTNNGDWCRFELDLPGGRWRAYTPEPASALGLALLGLLIRRR